MVKLIANGFPLSWETGQTVRGFLSDYARACDLRWPDQRTLIIDSTWAESNGDTRQALVKVAAQQWDRKIVVVPVDRYYQQTFIEQHIGTDYQCFGLAAQGTYFNLWPSQLLISSPKYHDSELLPTQVDHKFYVNYNRKPHPHRLEFVQGLRESGLLARGHVSLGRYPNSQHDLLSLGETRRDSASGHENVFRDPIIPNDTYSVGNLDRWRSSILAVISETTWDNDCYWTEKTFKAILGLRPFMANVCESKYLWLKNQGFDIYDDLWPTSVLASQFTRQSRAIYANIQWLANMTEQQQLDWYYTLRPRLERNRQHMIEWAEQQRAVFGNLCHFTID